MATTRKPTPPDTATGGPATEVTVDDVQADSVAELDVAQALADLTARVENLERHTAAPTPEQAEQTQVDRDRDLLSRTATSYAEAVEQEAARKRQADRARRPIGDGG